MRDLIGASPEDERLLRGFAKTDPSVCRWVTIGLTFRKAVMRESDRLVSAAASDSSPAVKRSEIGVCFGGDVGNPDLLLVKGAYQAGAFQADAFQVDVVVDDLTTRVRSLWTDFENGRWVGNGGVNPELLERNIGRVRAKAEDLILKWCP